VPFIVGTDMRANGRRFPLGKKKPRAKPGRIPIETGRRQTKLRRAIAD
jgi:hypothetical protein